MQRLRTYLKTIPARARMGAQDAWTQGKVGLALAGVFCLWVATLVVFGR